MMMTISMWCVKVNIRFWWRVSSDRTREPWHLVVHLANIRVVEKQQHMNHVRVACRVYVLHAVSVKHTQFDRETNGRHCSREWYMQMSIVASSNDAFESIRWTSQQYNRWFGNASRVYDLFVVQIIIAQKINICESALILIWNHRQWFSPHWKYCWINVVMHTISCLASGLVVREFKAANTQRQRWSYYLL